MVVVVVQLVERMFPKAEVRGSKLVSGNLIYYQLPIPDLASQWLPS